MLWWRWSQGEEQRKLWWTPLPVDLQGCLANSRAPLENTSNPPKILHRNISARFLAKSPCKSFEYFPIWNFSHISNSTVISPIFLPDLFFFNSSANSKYRSAFYYFYFFGAKIWVFNHLASVRSSRLKIPTRNFCPPLPPKPNAAKVDIMVSSTHPKTLETLECSFRFDLKWQQSYPWTCISSTILFFEAKTSPSILWKSI